jgi:hypothetical protein
MPNLYSVKGWRVEGGPPNVEIESLYDPLAGSKQLSKGIKGRGRHGWLIECFGCGKDFDSKGLRCCSTECEHAHHRREEIIKTLAQVGMEVEPKRECEECGHDIPTWRNGRKVSSATKFCSRRCAKRARKGAESHPPSQNSLLALETEKMCPSNGHP